MSSRLRRIKSICESPFKQTRISDFFAEVKMSPVKEKPQQTITNEQPKNSRLPFPLLDEDDLDVDMDQGNNTNSSESMDVSSSNKNSSGSSNPDDSSGTDKNLVKILENVAIPLNGENGEKNDKSKRKSYERDNADASPYKRRNAPSPETPKKQSPLKFEFHINNVNIQQVCHNCSNTNQQQVDNLSTPIKMSSKSNQPSPIPTTSSGKGASPMKSSGKPKMKFSPSTPKSMKILAFSPTKPGTSAETPEKTKKPAKVSSDSMTKPKDEKFNLKQLDCMKERFKDTLNNVNKRLLNDTEIKIIEDFLEMDVNKQYLLIKLFLHLPKWYHLMDFCKKIYLDQKIEEKKIHEIHDVLKVKQWIHNDLNELGLDTLLEMPSAPDLKNICKQYKLAMQCTKKENLIKALRDNCRKQPNLSKDKTPEDVLKTRIIESLGYRLKLKEEIRSSFHKAYFAQLFTHEDYIRPQNFFNDKIYTEVSRPNFRIESYSVFTNSKQFSRYIDAVVLKEKFYNPAGKDKNHKDKTMKILADNAFHELKKIPADGKWPDYFEEHLRRFSAEYQYISILNVASQKLVTFSDSVKTWLKFLIKHYKTHHALGYWYKQLAHIYTRYSKNYKEAANIVIEAFEFNKKKNCFNSIQLQELSNLATKLRGNRRSGLTKLSRDKLSALSESPINTDHFIKTTISGRTDRNSTVGRRLYSYTDDNGDQVYGNVEGLVINHYKSEDYKGIHCEGRLLNTLFVLLFWDIIYESVVAHTFISEYQEAPLDIFSRDFYKNRKAPIDERLEQISTEWSHEKIESEIKKNWDAHSHEKCVAKLESVTKNVEELLEMFRCIKRKVLAKVFERLVSNYKCYRSGLPDLFLWKSDSAEYKFVEVKGEGDKLSLKQILWIQYLMDNEACVEVCHVTGVGARKIKSAEVDNSD